MNVVVLDRRASLDRANVVLVVDALERDLVLRRVLARNRQCRFLECACRQGLHKSLCLDAENVLVNVVIGHGASVNRLTRLDVAFKATLVCESEEGVVGFHAKARKRRALAEREADVLDRVRDGLEKLAQQNAICEIHCKKLLFRVLGDGHLCRRLLRDACGIDFLVGHHDALFLCVFIIFRFVVRVLDNLALLGLGLLGLLGLVAFGIRVFGRDERVLLVVADVGSLAVRVRVGSACFVVNLALGLCLRRHFQRLEAECYQMESFRYGGTPRRRCIHVLSIGRLG